MGRRGRRRWSARLSDPRTGRNRRPPRRRTIHPGPPRHREPLCRNTLLTPPASAKEVRQFGFDISRARRRLCGRRLPWRGCRPTTTSSVDGWLAATGLAGDGAVVVDGAEVSLRRRADLVLRRLQGDAEPAGVRRRALPGPGRCQAAAAGRRPVSRWLVDRNGLDVVAEFGVRADPERWQEVLVRLTPRQYSISSSPLVSPHEVQLTVSVVRYRGRAAVRGAAWLDVPRRRPRRRTRAGLPAALAALPAARGSGDPDDHGRPRYRDRAVPRLPAGAPRAGSTGRNWLFFGDQHRAENFYYRDDLEDMVADGFLNHLDLAFSRDQRKRVYVQHKMIDAGAQVWRWLEDGAHFYVCGDAARMAKDVDAALTDHRPDPRRHVRAKPRTTTSASWSPRSGTCATSTERRRPAPERQPYGTSGGTIQSWKRRRSTCRETSKQR